MVISNELLVIAAIGVILFVIGLVKKIKFILKLGIVVAVIAFIATGGIAMITSAL